MAARLPKPLPFKSLFVSSGSVLGLYSRGSEHPYLGSCLQAAGHPESLGAEGPRTLPQPSSQEKRVSGEAGLGAPRPPPLLPPFPGYVSVPSLNLEHHPSSPPVPDGDLPAVSFHVSYIPSIPSSRHRISSAANMRGQVLRDGPRPSRRPLRPRRASACRLRNGATTESASCLQRADTC